MTGQQLRGKQQRKIRGAELPTWTQGSREREESGAREGQGPSTPPPGITRDDCSQPSVLLLLLPIPAVSVLSPSTQIHPLSPAASESWCPRLGT